MTRTVFTTLALLCCFMLSGQEISEKEKIRETVKTFFEGFHERDSLVMKSVFYEKPVIQTIARTKEGETELVNEELEKVLRGIVAIPMETEFLEVLHGIEVKIDGPLASAWTPYSFFMDKNFSHCGVNHFQLIRKGGQWKVISLIDTRRRQGCDRKEMP